MRTSYLSRRASTLEVIWSTHIWSKDWIMHYLTKLEVRLSRSQMLEMMQTTLELRRKTNNCHFALRLPSQYINGLSSHKLLSRQMRCSFLDECHLSFNMEGGYSNDITTTLHRSKADCPVSEEMVTVSVDGFVLDRIAKIMSYLRLGSSGKVLKKKKKERDAKGKTLIFRNEFDEEDKSSKPNGGIANYKTERETLPPPPPPPRKNHIDSREKQGPIVATAAAEEEDICGGGHLL